ncbi:MAG: acyl-CoA dehydrogenase family protein [Pseudomonadota bacterium]
MPYPFNDDHDAIREVARGFLAEWRDGGGLENAAKTGGDLGAWRETTALGWAGVAIDERYGGAGLGLLGRSVLMEEMGYALFSAPYFSSCCVAADYIEAIADEPNKERWLGAIAGGDAIATFTDGRSNIKFDGDQLSGVASCVPDAPHAEHIFVTVEKPAGEICLVVAERDAPGLSIDPLDTMDPTRAAGRVTFEGVDLKPSSILGGGSVAALDSARRRAYSSLAAECAGGARRCLDMTVEYAKERIQFGRPIASFQAVKHRCADMMVRSEGARSAAYLSAGADPDEIEEAAFLAKGYSSDAFFKNAGDAIQLHGGIGFTWDYPLHYYFKRAQANRSQYGSVERAFEELASCIIDGEGAADAG